MRRATITGVVVKENPLRRMLTTVISLALILGACGGDDSDPASVITEYLEVWNSENGEAVMVFYAEDAVVENHPNVDGATATGKTEILAIERSMDGFQGSNGTMEYINMEVSGNTVTFDNIFINGSGECFSSTGSVYTIENDLITLLVWGELDAGLCP